jgi:hypothetical protein
MLLQWLLLRHLAGVVPVSSTACQASATAAQLAANTAAAAAATAMPVM